MCAFNVLALSPNYLMKRPFSFFFRCLQHVVIIGAHFITCTLETPKKEKHPKNTRLSRLSHLPSFHSAQRLSLLILRQIWVVWGHILCCIKWHNPAIKLCILQSSLQLVVNGKLSHGWDLNVKQQVQSQKLVVCWARFCVVILVRPDDWLLQWSLDSTQCQGAGNTSI